MIVKWESLLHWKFSNNACNDQAKTPFLFSGLIFPFNILNLFNYSKKTSNSI